MTNAPRSFSVNTVAAMRAALEAAVQQISADHRTPATKAKMAERILQKAAEGVTNANELVAAAVSEGSRKAA